MKFCFIIAEYNPFHLGHLQHIRYIKEKLNAENVIVIMSGNFTQRGEPAILNKFTRAKEAVLSGADLVIELPTVFATANAETFALGAINVIKSLNLKGGLCFGVESGEKQDYINLASKLFDESEEFKKILKENLDKGYSLVKSKFETVKKLYKSQFDENLISLPNNILGLEYTKAILKNKCDMEIFPMKREGDHNDTKLKKGITSAKSIRTAIKCGKLNKIKNSVPKTTYLDLKETPYVSLDKIIMAVAISSSKQDLSKISDCTEGLENRIKEMLKESVELEDLIKKVCTKRYTESRIRRILTANLLKIDKTLVKQCLNKNLYAKVLAVNMNNKKIISEISKSSKIPLLTRKSDLKNLNDVAKKCFSIDELANDLYNVATNTKTNENQMLII